MDNNNLQDLERRMNGAIDQLIKDLSGIRTGRACPTLLDPIKVESYGAIVPLNQVANISAGDARTLLVSVWDKSMVKNVEKAIRESSLGLNPAVDGASVRVFLPELNQQRRQELSKVAAKYSEDCKISIRNVRRDGMEIIKKNEKDKIISEDEHRRFSEEIQEMTDKFIKKVDGLLASKQKDILNV